MSDEDDRVQEMQSRILALETTAEQRHAFALQVFSCVVDLWGLAVNMYDVMPENPEKRRFRDGLSTLGESVNEAQRLSALIVETLGEDTGGR